MKQLLKQVMGFAGISGVGWIIDFCTYTILGFSSKNLVVNNMISSWIGVTFVFIFATRKVFHNNSKILLKWKYVIYLVYQCVFIYYISKLLNMINTTFIFMISSELVRTFSPIFSKILITPVTMILNFLVMKGIIEKL